MHIVDAPDVAQPASDVQAMHELTHLPRQLCSTLRHMSLQVWASQS